MPASTLDPISSVLKHAFQGSGHKAATALEAGLVSAAKKTLLATTSVAFDPPVRHLGGSISAIKKSGFIFLNPGKKQQQQDVNGKDEGPVTNGEAKAAVVPSPPKPKVVLFPLHSVEVGYRNMRISGAGMLNMGNTCYLNSTLQALFHTPALYNYLTSGLHQKQCKANNGFLQSCLICALTATLRDTLQNTVTRPNRIYEKLKLICKHLVHGRQEDAHEFLRYLIESLQRSFLNSCHAHQSLDNASKETTPFNQIFGGYMRQDVTCLKCKYVSITFQHFMDLLLDIRQATTIEEALEIYFRPERISNGDGGNMYKCEKCKVKVPAKKRSFVARPPVVLCIQLKRFSLLGGKISKPVQLNRRVDVACYVKGHGANAPVPLQYKLVSMITHVGPSPNCGHYTAIGEALNGQFYQFDDSSVRPISANQALNTVSYVVFYEMTKATKEAWTNRGEDYAPSTSQYSGISPQQSDQRPASKPSVNPSPKPCTVTSATVNGLHANLPKIIPTFGPNKIGVVPFRNGPTASPSIQAKKPSLVPYGEDSDEEEPVKAMNGHAAVPKSPFVPRSVTINALKRSQEPRPSTPATLIRDFDPMRPSSSASNASDSSAVKASRSGVWSVTDTDHHNPSIHSDNSTGSTNGWKVTPKKAIEATEQPKPMMHPEPATFFQAAPVSPVSSAASTPEKRVVKRGSSQEDYEDELDRGRTKKVKKKHASEDSDERGGSSSSNKSNPFQTFQNRNYDKKQDRDHHHRASSNSSWSGRGSWNQHREHSYHAGGGDARDGKGFYRRSHSFSSLNGGGGDSASFHRDRHRSSDRSDRPHFGSGGGGYRDGHRDHYSDRRQSYNRYKR